MVVSKLSLFASCDIFKKRTFVRNLPTDGRIFLEREGSDRDNALLVNKSIPKPC